MGMTKVACVVRRPDGHGRAVRLELLVDTGAVFAVLPERTWRALGLRPLETETFGLADGSTVSRAISEARFEIGTRVATSPVVLGQGDDAPAHDHNPFTQRVFHTHGRRLGSINNCQYDKGWQIAKAIKVRAGSSRVAAWR